MEIYATSTCSLCRANVCKSATFEEFKNDLKSVACFTLYYNGPQAHYFNVKIDTFHMKNYFVKACNVTNVDGQTMHIII